MDYTLLRTLHVAGALALFASLGAVMLGNSKGKAASILHGVSLIFIAVIGFAMLKKPPMHQYYWMVKVGIWFFIGLAPALVKKKVLPPAVVFILCLTAAGLAAWLGMTKPF